MTGSKESGASFENSQEKGGKQDEGDESEDPKTLFLHLLRRACLRVLGGTVKSRSEHVRSGPLRVLVTLVIGAPPAPPCFGRFRGPSRDSDRG